MTAETLEPGQSLLVLADRVHTLADPSPVGALLVRDGRIAASGSSDDMRRLDSSARLLDLTGAIITPGLTDAHIHLTEWAFARRETDLANAESPQHAAALVAAQAGSTAAPGAWLRGRGWSRHRFGDGEPHRTLLDDVAPHRPVALQSHDMHALWVNSAALHAAGIDASTPDPDGGTIVRDGAGEPTGLLLEWAGTLVARVIPEPALGDACDAVRAAQRELHALGITGVHSYPGIHLTQPDPFTVLQHLRERGELRLRALQHIPLHDLEHAIALGIRSRFGDEWIRIGALKMFLDGALGSRTAWMREPYEGDTSRGMRVMEPDEFRDTVRRAAAAGLASTVHAIGDAAVCLALDVLCDPAVRVPALPHRIEHLQCCPPERFGDAAAAGVVCSMQPAHLITDWSVAERCWGSERSRGVFSLASLLRNGTILAFGSDAPVEPVDPRRGFLAAALRQDLNGEPRDGWCAQERISALDTLRGYTVGAARAAGDAAPAGTLAAGAPADFVAWDRDPLGDPQEIMSMRCVAAIVGGDVVHAC